MTHQLIGGETFTYTQRTPALIAKPGIAYQQGTALLRHEKQGNLITTTETDVQHIEETPAVMRTPGLATVEDRTPAYMRSKVFHPESETVLVRTPKVAIQEHRRQGEIRTPTSTPIAHDEIKTGIIQQKRTVFDDAVAHRLAMVPVWQAYPIKVPRDVIDNVPVSWTERHMDELRGEIRTPFEERWHTAHPYEEISTATRDTSHYDDLMTPVELRSQRQIPITHETPVTLRSSHIDKLRSQQVTPFTQVEHEAVPVQIPVPVTTYEQGEIQDEITHIHGDYRRVG